MPVDPALLLGFLALSMLLSAVPGPSVILATSRAIVRDRGEAMWIVSGNALGGLVLLALVVAGLGAVVVASSALFTVVKILGAIYLFWLGVRALLSAWRDPAPDLGDVSNDADESSRWSLLREGFLVGVSNPKSVASLVAVLPQFVDPGLGAVPLQMLLIGLAGGVAQLVIESTWVLAAGGLRTWFRRRPARIRTMKGAGGVAMIGLAGRLALQRPTA